MKALVIDDNNCLRSLLSVFLKDIGFDAHEAPNGQIAFEMVQGTRYDVIISDLDMPVINGKEFYYLVEQHDPRMLNRIIFATGSGLDGRYADFFKQIRCPVLDKPFSLKMLRSTIENHLGIRCESARHRECA